MGRAGARGLRPVSGPPRPSDCDAHSCLLPRANMAACVFTEKAGRALFPTEETTVPCRESPEGVVGRPQLLKERIGQMSGVRNKNSTGIWRQLQNGCLDSLPARLFSERGLSSQQRAARHARPPCVAWWLWSGHLWVAELELCPGLGLGPCWVRHFLVWPVPHKRES